jgi:hypothetical protein
METTKEKAMQAGVISALAAATLLGGPRPSAAATAGALPWSFRAAPVVAQAGIPGPMPGLWLNVRNEEISFAQALTGFPILAAGWANLSRGAAFYVRFAAGIVNGDGPELVLLDARFDAASYVVTTDYDDYHTPVAVPGADFIASGVHELYYYGPNAEAPFEAEVYGAELDLSDFGVPLGAAITTLRVRAANQGADPLGVGSLVPLDVGGMVSGLSEVSTVHCANARTQVALRAALSDGRWDCRAAGLVTSAGDTVTQRIAGAAAAGVAHGDLGGIDAASVTVWKSLLR